MHFYRDGASPEGFCNADRQSKGPQTTATIGFATERPPDWRLAELICGETEDAFKKVRCDGFGAFSGRAACQAVHRLRMTHPKGRCALLATLAIVLLASDTVSAVDGEKKREMRFSSAEVEKAYQEMLKGNDNYYDKHEMDIKVPIHTILHVVNPKQISRLITLKMNQMSEKGRKVAEKMQELYKKQQQQGSIKKKRAVREAPVDGRSDAYEGFVRKRRAGTEYDRFIEIRENGVPKPYLVSGTLHLTPLF
ncbi:hypothetical protein QR680_005841 [Steinernema hermaphroditum]|uniref:Uncharacterized protein n=1 Tax=Steinernema hermaphroditum TaxID=289476 RepID=A0AA39HUL0_9BILA|nr:hypothetical protein QR680_005841 [Steinernema hermaphroditum]